MSRIVARSRSKYVGDGISEKSCRKEHLRLYQTEHISENWREWVCWREDFTKYVREYVWKCRTQIVWECVSESDQIRASGLSTVTSSVLKGFLKILNAYCIVLTHTRNIYPVDPLLSPFYCAVTQQCDWIISVSATSWKWTDNGIRCMD